MAQGEQACLNEPVLVVTQPHVCDARLAIAAVRAGAVALVDLGFAASRAVRQATIDRLSHAARDRGEWGTYWDMLEQRDRSPRCLRGLTTTRWPVLLLGGIDFRRQPLAEILTGARYVAKRVFVEAYSPTDALLAQSAGFDGLVLKGNESGGRVGNHSSFMLLQHVHGMLTIPYWIRGGIHPCTAPAATLAGATGVLLCEQLWLTRESPLAARDIQALSRCDGSETTHIGNADRTYRFFARHNRAALNELRRTCDLGGDWSTELARMQLSAATQDAGSRGPTLLPAGQDIAFSASLARECITVGHVIQRYRTALAETPVAARRHLPLAPSAPLARRNGTRYPIVQGPMTRVSDGAEFCAAVAGGGALPFLALGMMKRPEIETLLRATRRRLEGQPWGVGLLAFLPPEYLSAQMQVVRELRPPFALLAGGRPDQVTKLQQHGIKTYVHAPSPGILNAMIKQGVRHIVLEGRECGGHVGPRSSFALWASAVDVLLKAKIKEPAEYEILFAGGIHDALSAAMVSLVATPLIQHGMHVGVVLGSAYIGTEEAVATGAITADYQQQVLRCSETVLLQSGIGHASRCVKTPFAEEFESQRRTLLQAGKSADEIRMELELLCLGRLRLASKGLARQDNTPDDPDPTLVPVARQQQHEQGMFMIGDAATLMREPQTIAQLHQTISEASGELIEQFAKRTASLRPATHRPTRRMLESEPLAVIGMACRFPECRGTAEYWRNILAKFNAVREIPAERWDGDLFFTTDRFDRDKCYSKWGAFLDEVVFNPLAYGIPPASMLSIEPVQLIALDVAGMALRDAGYFDRPFPRDRTSVIFAVSGPHNLGMAYGFRTMLRQYLRASDSLPCDTQDRVIRALDRLLPTWTEDSLPGFLNNMVAGRVSNHFDLRGPNFVVDAACAASLAALHIAVEQLRSGTCDAALVGAADATNSPVEFMSFAKVFALSPRGKPCPFDDTADGIVLGEGVGAVVLKRLADAERDGDQIHAVIRGIGTASDGRNRSLTAPDLAGQIETLRRAYANAAVDPATIGLVEAHGTGTALGDRVEAEALAAIMTDRRPDQNRCAVGSVKSMIGHAKTAAGLASLIKTCLALKHKTLPPTGNVTVPNRHVDFSNGPLCINTEPRPWIHGSADHPRRAAVSAFGFGGTNFHAVLEEYQDNGCGAQIVTPRLVTTELFFWIAAERAPLVEALRRFQTRVAEWRDPDIGPLALGLYREMNRASKELERRTCRLAIVAENVDDLRTKITVVLDSLSREAVPPRSNGVNYREAPPVNERDVCFLFPGQGSQRCNMLRDLLLQYPAGLTLFTDADQWLRRSLHRPLSDYIFPIPAFDEPSRRRQQDALNETTVAQPALGVACLFALDLLRRFGLSPGVVAGHSYGELVALHAAGCITRRQTVELSALRGTIVANTTRSSKGGLAVVMAGEETVSEHLRQWRSPLSIANANTPNQTVIGGPLKLMDEAVRKFSDLGLRARRLAVTAAFHTTELKPAADEFAGHMNRVDIRPPSIPIFSNVTAARFPDRARDIRSLMVRQLTERVRFTEEVRTIWAAGGRVFIEVGPGTTLTSFVRHIVNDTSCETLALDIDGRHGVTQLAHLLAQSFAIGLPVRCEPWFADRTPTIQSVEEAIALDRLNNAPNKSHWILSGARARRQVPRERAASDRSALPVTVDTDDGTPQRSRHKMNAEQEPNASKPSRIERRAGEISGLTEDMEAPSKADFGNVPSANAASNDASISEPMSPVRGGGWAHAGTPGDPIQENLACWLELQQSQQETHQQFLRLQERYLDYLQDGNGSARHNPAATVAKTPEQLMPLRVPPAPTLPPIQSTVPDGKTPNGNQASPAPGNAPGSMLEATKVSREATGGAPSSILSVEGFRRVLLDLISDRTGYTEDTLDETLLMEADLGIDSIKRIEIFSGLTDYCSFMMRQDRSDEELLMTFTNLKTIHDIVEAYAEERARYIANAGTNRHGTGSETERIEAMEVPSQAREPQRLLEDRAATAVDPIERLVVQAVEAPLEHGDNAAWRWPRDHALLVIGRISDAAMAWSASVGGTGPKLCHVVAGDDTGRIAPSQFVADVSSAESISHLHRLLRDERVQIAGLLNLLPLSKPFSTAGMNDTGVALDLMASQYHLLREFESELRGSLAQGGGKLINVTSLGGKLGIGGGRDLPLAQAVSVGLMKSVGCEWPGTLVKNIDVEPDPDPQWLMDSILRELMAGDTSTEVGLTQHGRWTPELRPTSPNSDARRTTLLDSNAVILATGGARGITAEVVKRIAETYHCRFILIGRTSLEESALASESPRPNDLPPDDHTHAIRTRKGTPRPTPDQEVKATLRYLEQHATDVEYHAVDVRDTDRFAAMIDAVYAKYGRIDGVIHGAGVTDDRLISSKTMSSITDVVRTKIDGAQVLARNLRVETLRFLVFFSSVSARFGNPGQCDYCAANEYLNKLADDLNTRWPARVVAINWGPWDRGLVTPALASVWAAMRIQVIPAAMGADAFLAELNFPKDEYAEVVVGCSIREIAQRRLGMSP